MQLCCSCINIMQVCYLAFAMVTSTNSFRLPMCRKCQSQGYIKNAGLKIWEEIVCERDPITAIGEFNRYVIVKLTNSY